MNKQPCTQCRELTAGWLNCKSMCNRCKNRIKRGERICRICGRNIPYRKGVMYSARVCRWKCLEEYKKNKVTKGNNLEMRENATE